MTSQHTDSARAATPSQTPSNVQPYGAIPIPLFLFALFYGGMTCIAGVLGAKQVAIGPLAVEAGIFPFLLLVAISSTISQLYGRHTAHLLVRFGFVPLATAILLTWIVLQLPTDPGMYEPAKEAFPIILSQSWRLMVAGILAYGISMSLNVYVFAKLTRNSGKFVALRGAIASMISQVIDTLIFITVAFYGVRPIAELLMGQALAKVVLSIVFVPPVIQLLLYIAKRIDQRGADAAHGD